MSNRLELRSALTLTAAAALVAFGLLTAIAPLPAHADYSETILHTFTTYSGDGNEPIGGLTLSPNGLFYGATIAGGKNGNGIVYSTTSASKSFSVVYNFGDANDDGSQPYSSPAIGSDGTLYGVCESGGAYGDGTIFKLTPAGHETILHSFAGGSDGAVPVGALTIGNDGKLYGVTTGDSGTGSAADGTIFSIDTDGSDYLTQYRFNSANEGTAGEAPYCTLAPASSSSSVFYGTTDSGGSAGYGTVFAFAPGTTDGSGSLKLLHTFGDGTVANDGESPELGRFQIGANGNLYGVTLNGGANGAGVVYEISTGGAVTILHSFTGYSDNNPDGSLTLASDGNYYGITAGGGDKDYGSAYRIAPDGSNYGVVYNFGANDDDGNSPLSEPVEDSDGNLLGTTTAGGAYSNNTAHGILYKLAAGLPNPVKIKTLSVSPSTVMGGSANATGTVTLAKRAPTAGAKITLTSSNTSAATVPSSVTISGAALTATFTITSLDVSSSSGVTITAAYNGSSASSKLTVTPGSLSSVYLSPTSTTGGTSTTANRAYLSGNATTDTTVALTSSNPAVATVPSSVLIKTGSGSHVFTITTQSVTSKQTVTITAKANGVTKSATLTVVPTSDGLKSVLLSPTSLTGGSSSTANRTYLNGNATQNDIVMITSSNTAVAQITTNPVTIKTGSSSHVFTIATTKVTKATTVTISATANGVSKTATLTVNP